MECLFCKIAARQIPAHIIYSDDAVVAFLDIHPRAPGHTMVVPKRHAETVLEVASAEGGSLFAGVAATVRLLSRALRPDGFTIGINQGRASGQAVDHLHIHVIPRFTDDGGTSLHGVVANPPAAPLEEIADRIRTEGSEGRVS